MGLAAPSPFPLRDVEDDVGAAMPQGVDDAGTRPEADYLVAEFGERAAEMPDGRLGVVLLEGVFGQMVRRVPGFTL